MQLPELDFFVPTNRVDARGVPTHVDGLNEIVAANRANRYAGAKQERENVANVAQFARAAMAKAHLAPPEYPADVFVCFIEPNRRRDVSNVFGGLKWVLDGLSRPRGRKDGAGAIYDDSCRWVRCIPSVEYTRDPKAIGVRIHIRYYDETDTRFDER